MKKIISTLAFVALVSQLHATELADMVNRIASDLNIKVVRTGHRHQIGHKKYANKDRRAHKRVIKRKKRVHKRIAKSKIAAIHKNRKKLAHTNARKLSFHTLSEYKHVAHHRFAPRKHIKRRSKKRSAKHFINHNSRKLKSYVGNGWYSDDDGYYNEEWEDTNSKNRSWRHSRHKQHGYRHYRRQWYLTYLYERASFCDSYGFNYGDFDRYGFMFDGYFYRYDYNYTYQDRLHGKGIFEHRYYRPTRQRIATRYGFWDNDLAEPYDDGFVAFGISISR